jgi:hypothetical protein
VKAVESGEAGRHALNAMLKRARERNVKKPAKK